MKTQELLSRLESVKETGPGRWIARCSAHEDRTPSLAIRETDDKLLLHCFAGCTPHEVVSSVGMELSDLFPDIPVYHNNSGPVQKRFLPGDVLQCLSGETMFLVMCANDLANGETLSEKDLQRLSVAHRRLANAAKAAGL